MPLVYLEWEDACSQTGWHTKEELEKFIKQNNAIVNQVGWIYKDDKTYIVLISRLGQEIYDSIDDEAAGYGHIQKIPKTWIRKKVVLNKYVTKNR